MEGPRGLHADELDSCLDLVNRVFRTAGKKAPTMRQEFPLLFAPENLDRLRVFVDQGRVVCHVGVLYQTIRIGACTLPVANIGAVCTEPDLRGKGLATTALESAMETMRRDGRVLMLVSGSRSLYARLGCAAVGRRLTFRARAQDLARLADSAFTVRRRGEGDVAEMIRLHQAELRRYERTESTLRILLPAYEDHGSTAAIVERPGERPAAYLVVRHGGPMLWAEPGVGRVLEYAGDRQAVAGALGATAELAGVSELLVGAVAGEDELAERLTSASLPPKAEHLMGVFRTVDAAGLVRSLEPWWRERLGAEIAGSMTVVEREGEPVGLSVGGQFLPTPGPGPFTRLVFSAATHAALQDPDTQEIVARVAPALPVLLPDPGLNYV